MAKTTLQVSIPEPCHEDWAKMTPTQCGAYCQACQKEVVDFSRMSEAEIVARLSKASGKVCGRIPATMLNRELVKHEPDLAWYSWKKWAVAAGVLLGAGNVKANNKLYTDTAAIRNVDTTLALPNVNIVGSKRPAQDFVTVGQTVLYNQLISDTSITLSGKVTDEINEPVILALVTVGKDSSINVRTDFDGNYSILIPKEYYNKAIIVQVSYVGYNNEQFTFIANKSTSVNIQLKALEYSGMVGGLFIDTPRSKIRRFFHRIGNAFRKPENRY